jgi:hypothetical protein
MTDKVIAALIIGASLIVGGALWGGRFSTTPIQQGGAYVVDRFTGDVRFCTPTECRPVEPERSSSQTFEDFLRGKKSN